jgi:hypothetical protein
MNFRPPIVGSFRPFLPAKDFGVSKRFYQHLGFRLEQEWDENSGAVFALGTSSFILQNFYDEHFARNFMMQLVVPNLDQWWEHIQSAELAKTFHVAPPRAPKKQSWGQRRALAVGTVAGYFDARDVTGQLSGGDEYGRYGSA